MISLRIMLVLQILREIVSHQASSCKVPARCQRCDDECLLDFHELTLSFGPLHALTGAGQVLRCEKCDGRLARRSLPQHAPTGAVPSRRVIVDLATHRRRMAVDNGAADRSQAGR